MHGEEEPPEDNQARCSGLANPHKSYLFVWMDTPILSSQSRLHPPYWTPASHDVYHAKMQPLGCSVARFGSSALGSCSELPSKQKTGL